MSEQASVIPDGKAERYEAERETKLRRDIEILVTVGIDPSNMRVTTSFAQFLPHTDERYLDWRKHNPGYWADLIERDAVVATLREERASRDLCCDTLAILDAMTTEEKSDLRRRIGR